MSILIHILSTLLGISTTVLLVVIVCKRGDEMTVQELVERDLKKARINLEQAKARANIPLPEVEHLEELCRLRARIVELTKATDVARDIIADLKSVGIDEWRYPIIAELKKKYTENKEE